MKGTVAIGKQNFTSIGDWQKTTFLVTLTEGKSECLFFGWLEQLTVMEEKDRMLLRLSAASETISMDRKKKSRSFQNPDMTYQQILNKIIEAYPSLDSNWIRA